MFSSSRVVYEKALLFAKAEFEGGKRNQEFLNITCNAFSSHYHLAQAKQQTISLCMAYRPYCPSDGVYCPPFFHSPQ
jgi:hypothetical protein